MKTFQMHIGRTHDVIAPKSSQPCRLMSKPVSRNVAVDARRTKTATATVTTSLGEGLTPEQKARALADTIDRIANRFGTNTITKLSDTAMASVQTFPSGSLTLDAALGGGYPRGRIVEVYGPEASGKTTLAMHACAEVQRQGGQVAYIDVEHAFDKKYAQSLGIDLDRFWYSQPMTGEEALEVMDELCRSSAVDLVVIDSVAALVPRAELEGDIGNQQIGLQARLLSQALRKLSGSAAKSNTTLFFINQLRNKIGVMFGNPETTSGGQALKYYSSVRIDVRKKETVTVREQAVANKVRAKVVKNKIASPHKEAVFDIVYGKGIDFMGGLLDTAEGLGVVARRGAYYYFNEAKLGQGRDKALAALREDADRVFAIEAAVRDVLARNPDAALVDAEEGSIAGPEEMIDMDEGL